MKYYAGIGSRHTPPAIRNQMERIAAYLRSGGWILRSGHALGADMAFERGVGFGDRPEKDIFTAKMHIPPAAFTIAERYHPGAWHKFPSHVQRLHARNSQIILGESCFGPNVRFVVCWTEDGKAGGGTGQAIRVALACQIPVYDLGRLSLSDVMNALWEEEGKVGLRGLQPST